MTDQPKQALPDVNRRACTSAAMIGFAVSMGGVLVPHAGDSAIAAEPKTSEPVSAAVPTTPNFDVAAVSSTSSVDANSSDLKAETSSWVSHTVQPGQTLWKIAQLYQANPSEVAAANGLVPGAVVRAGQVLKVPVNRQVASAATVGTDTNDAPGYYGLVASAVTPAPSLEGSPASDKAVPSEQPSSLLVSRAADDRLKVRQETIVQRLQQTRANLKLSLAPSQGTVEDSSVTVVEASTSTGKAPGVVTIASVQNHRVSEGETLSSIARAYGISQKELAEINGIDNPNLIRLDQMLVIPGTSQEGAAVKSLDDSRTTVGDHKVATEPATPRDQSTVVVTEPADTTLAPKVPVTAASRPETIAPLAAQPDARTTNSAIALGLGGVRSNESDVKLSTAPLVNRTSGNRESSSRGRADYASSLRSEIVKLREKYRANAASPTQVAAAPVAGLAAKVPSVTRSSTSNATVNPSGYSQGLRNQVRSLQQRSRQPEVASQKAQSAVRSQEMTVTPKAPKSQVVAAAPLGSQAYEPLTASSLGRMVSPDMPPLGDLNAYLPGNAGRFAGLIWPAKGVLTSGYGWRWGRMHRGIDVAAPVGTPIMAAAPGKVITAGWNSGGYGNLVEIQHADGTITLYGHNDRILVQEGQEVDQGQQIAEMGSTGYSTGPHLHFEVHLPGQGAVNPMAYLGNDANS